jgi:ubiquinol-cytochrome c reductase iron-sulfur subunit
MNQRQLLERLLMAMIGFGLIMLMIPFFSSEEQRTETAYPVMDIDVSGLAPGDTLQLTWDDRPILVLRRTPAMLEGLRRPEQVLADPWSKQSRQPAAAKNVYRSLRPEYLIVESTCDGGTVEYWHAAMLGQRFPQGALVCVGNDSVYDLAGRVLSHMPDKHNLMVPPYQFVEEQVIRLGELP